jgi:hypothetical protein
MHVDVRPVFPFQYGIQKHRQDIQVSQFRRYEICNLLLLVATLYSSFIGIRINRIKRGAHCWHANVIADKSSDFARDMWVHLKEKLVNKTIPRQIRNGYEPRL